MSFKKRWDSGDKRNLYVDNMLQQLLFHFDASVSSKWFIILRQASHVIQPYPSHIQPNYWYWEGCSMMWIISFTYNGGKHCAQSLWSDLLQPQRWDSYLIIWFTYCSFTAWKWKKWLKRAIHAFCGHSLWKTCFSVVWNFFLRLIFELLFINCSSLKIHLHKNQYSVYLIERSYIQKRIVVISQGAYCYIDYLN